jgi:hypothetical protein
MMHLNREEITMISNKLLHAAKYAVRTIAEERAGGTIESERKMETAQKLLFEAIREADPKYFYTGEEQK